MDKVLISTDDTANMLSIGKTRLYTEILAKGLLPSVRIGRRRLIPVSAVRELAERMVRDALSDAGTTDE